MKALLSFALVMIFSAASYAWDEPEDFRGLKWGVSSGEADSHKRVKLGVEEICRVATGDKINCVHKSTLTT